ncbi:MAG: heterodisulfide reductase-related iron-sulfur binding cluster, partial [Ginsengibacter sp.]
MQVALFIPCYIDQFYPHVGAATLELLGKAGCGVSFPVKQTCCGQPMANSGFEKLATGCNRNFIKNFSMFDYIVSPSGSCVLHIKEHLRDERQPEEVEKIKRSIYELSEFLTDVLKMENFNAAFPYKVGFHNGCHGQRGLHLSSMSELMVPAFSKPEALLKNVKGLQLYNPVRG